MKVRYITQIILTIVILFLAIVIKDLDTFYRYYSFFQIVMILYVIISIMNFATVKGWIK